MFVIVLSYVKPVSNVERLMTEHRVFLMQFYTSGYFLLSGRQEPRTGGVIICQADSREQVEQIVQHDPFSCAGIAEYNAVGFWPSMTEMGLESFKVLSDQH